MKKKDFLLAVHIAAAAAAAAGPHALFGKTSSNREILGATNLDIQILGKKHHYE